MIRGQTTRLKMVVMGEYSSGLKPGCAEEEDGECRRNKIRTIVVYGKRARALWPCVAAGKERERERKRDRERISLEEGALLILKQSEQTSLN